MLKAKHKNEINDDSKPGVKKSPNQKKREARPTIHWSMDLASFSTPQIKRTLRASSLKLDVFNALMLVKVPLWILVNTKVGDQKTLQALAGTETQIIEEEDDDDDDDQFEYSIIQQSQEFVNTVNR
ncbi:UPF0307 protein isoform X3 [Gossypium australe]|uniref:UPF0307 protein isoform X3 n=1 Tax=Gossypium australe TaxID=47621 RepID=A0A5B6U6Q4_9ROSI|nr:UPF0307 protein isoform X3 [Gossypium australe]